VKREDLQKTESEVLEAAVEPPVVARLVIEIRSDGSRTIARGALEDVAAGEHVAVRAEGTSPLSLAMALARSLIKVPFLGRALSRGLLSGRPKK
jgi:hypothetical protein